MLCTVIVYLYQVCHVCSSMCHEVISAIHHHASLAPPMCRCVCACVCACACECICAHVSIYVCVLNSNVCVVSFYVAVCIKYVQWHYQLCVLFNVAVRRYVGVLSVALTLSSTGTCLHHITSMLSSFFLSTESCTHRHVAGCDDTPYPYYDLSIRCIPWTQPYLMVCCV